ncbi:MAG TPA: hypothetical protein VJQ44_13575 [Gemmatimonadales bacterium]|nr:hypothetical protein [Gemmatimonadales bacterium]
MIVYRETRRSVEPDSLLADLERGVARLGARPPHDAIVGTVVDLGIAESAILDAVHPVADDDCEPDRRFGGAALCAGHLLLDSSRGRWERLGMWTTELLTRIRATRDIPLPARCAVTVPEGFAHYAVWPEAYAASALRLHRELRPARAWVIGLRSIGAPLSAAVAAALRAEGCVVLRQTLRPRGHPFDRRPVLGARLMSRLREDARDAFYLIVDEGPGLSGSSFAGVAAALCGLGVPEERVVMLPSWLTEGRDLKSGLARRHWSRHRQFAPAHQSPWPAPAPPAHLDGDERLMDLSAGRWRARLLGAGTPWPAVHPQHERRKAATRTRWFAFAGLGRFGARTIELQAALADAGLAPRPLALDQGMLVRELVEGTPLPATDPDGPTLEKIAGYLCHRARHYQAACDDRAALAEMALSNAGEAGGGELAHAAGERLRSSGFPGDAPAVALDGRMQPHEWLRTRAGLLKLDATDHHADHFFPGSGDIAWDLAGAAVEFALSRDAREAFTRFYVACSRDQGLDRRLPGYIVAYLAFRLGYASLAAETLAGTDDGARFTRLSRRYLRMLRRELGVRAPATTGV